MSTWRRVATEKLPDCREIIEKSERISAFWVEIWWPFVDAHEEPANHEFIGRVYQFATWCLNESHSNDIASATAIGFYENLSVPMFPIVRREVARWLSDEDFDDFENLFRYHLDTNSAFEEFQSEFRARKIEIRKEALTRKKASK